MHTVTSVQYVYGSKYVMTSCIHVVYEEARVLVRWVNQRLHQSCFAFCKTGMHINTGNEHLSLCITTKDPMYLKGSKGILVKTKYYILGKLSGIYDIPTI